MITITKKEFEELTAFIKANYGIHLKAEKESLVIGRLQNILIQNGFHNFSEYYQYLLKDKTGMAVTGLLDKITTNHTFFMREVDHFTYLKETVLPYLANHIKDKDLRVWSAGCSSGEEPYTLAMIIDEFFGRDKLSWDTKILATDISNRVLEQARKGIYRKNDIETLPSNWKLNYFENYDRESSAITAKLKNEIVFRKFNLMESSFPFKKKFHTIFCRNVMIYFDERTKVELVNKFYHAMEPGGYLFIGHSESLKRDETLFKYVMPAVYRKL